ncbi:coiled-coil domain-containing protein 18-like isoform X2 [Betta splendens]|uniref:Coiled-coil domain-containing protein 18-like isoform X2 n=1 Tax=Betta splendens TaxID=158456 RepID=A0A9W2XQN4_BETSP|nr:coiled-coil domain-containing protein 18-like isoform X2 [Betta splendens]
MTSKRYFIGSFQEKCGTMSHETRLHSEDTSEMWRSGHGALNLAPLPGDRTEATYKPGTETSSMKHLIEEMKTLYKQRLRCLELDSSLTREELLQKVDFLWSYVNDFADQNQVLLQTIEELHKETEHKCSSWGMKLCTSDPNLSVSGVDLKTLSLEDLDRPAAHVPQNPVSLVQLKGLKIHLQNTNMVASDLELGSQEHLEHKLKNLQSELSCLQQIHKDNMKEIAEKDICITKLQVNLELLQQESSDSRDQVSRLNVKVKELQEELKGKEEEWVKQEEDLKQKTDEERRAQAQAAKSWAEKAAVLNSEIQGREERVRRLDQNVAALRASQDSLKRTLAVKEKHTRQLLRDNAQLRESLATLRSQSQKSECTLSHISEALDQSKSCLEAERRQRQQIQDQLHHSSTEVERLQKELAMVHHATEKKIQKRELKICALAKELTESKQHRSECQEELFKKEKDLEKGCEERDELRVQLEAQSRECVLLIQTRERLEADLALSRERVHTSRLEVRSRDQFIVQLRAEVTAAEQKHWAAQEQVASLEDEVRHLNRDVRGRQEEASQLSRKIRDIEQLKEQKEKEQQELHDQLRISQQQLLASHQQLKGAKQELENATLQTQEHKEALAALKQEHAAVLEKANAVQGQVEQLEEELRYSQQQLRESQLASRSVQKELVELERRHQEKVGQWESSREALDRLTDELQANQNLLRDSRHEVEHFKNRTESLRAQVDALKQQKLMLEQDLHLYQQSHSHSDDEYLSLAKCSQQLQQHCSEQVERFAECEKTILHMKSELERQAEKKASLKQMLASSHSAHLSSRSKLEQEVSHLKKEVGRLELELADSQKVHADVLGRSEEELKGARREALRSSRELEVQRGEVQRLQAELREEEDKLRCAVTEKLSLSACVRRLSQEVEELRSKHRVTVEELAARADEARQMEGCLNEGKLAEEKMRSMARSLEMEVAGLRKNLREAVDQKAAAEREKQGAQDQVDTLQLELEAARSDRASLCHESQMVMTNVSQWISEQKASNESLAAQMKAQSKLLLIATEEREHLQETNDTLKAEVERLKGALDEKDRDVEGFKAQIRHQSMRLDRRTAENQGCVALNLSKIEDMQTRMRSNLEAIGMLNQQLNTLSQENEQLRRQLDEERCMRRQMERLLPPTSQHCSTHLPVSPGAHPPPECASLPPLPHLPHPLSSTWVTGDTSSAEWS